MYRKGAQRVLVPTQGIPCKPRPAGIYRATNMATNLCVLRDPNVEQFRPTITHGIHAPRKGTNDGSLQVNKRTVGG